jgi:hypothetical protein
MPYKTDKGVARAELERLLNTDTDECLLWRFGKINSGYGITGSGPGVRRNRLVHVVACERAHGPRPDGMQVGHTCGVKLCVNKLHVRWVTPTENAADKVLHGTVLRGEQSPAAKLTVADVYDIRRRAAAGIERQRDIAAEYGIDQAHVSGLHLRKFWAWLPDEPEIELAVAS